MSKRYEDYFPKYPFPTVVSIDPGLVGSGFAIWELSQWEKQVSPLATFSLVTAYDDWIMSAREYSRMFEVMCINCNVSKAYCEWPRYFESGVGHAATTKGDIYKLAFLVGVYARIIWVRGGMFEEVPVTEWKGQLPKNVVERRIRRLLPDLMARQHSPTNHDWDAVGIGLYKKGFFNVKA